VPWLQIHDALVQLWAAYWALKEENPAKAEQFKEVVILFTKALRGVRVSDALVQVIAQDATLLNHLLPVKIEELWCDACKMAHAPYKGTPR
jgi:hypothetical protein